MVSLEISNVLICLCVLLLLEESRTNVDSDHITVNRLTTFS